MHVRSARALDLLAVIVFVAVGRSSHGESESAGGLLNTLWPFLGGLVIGWLLVAWSRRPLTSWSGAALVWVGILAGGVTLRAIAGQGLAFSFVAVIAAFFALTLFGWRLVANRVLARVRG